MTEAPPAIRIVWNIPAMLRTVSNGNAEVEVALQNASYQEALTNLIALYPGFAEHFDIETAKPRSYLSIFHNDEQVTDFSGTIPIRDRDELLIVPALAGG
jgi:molybdopterin converting factor small subunit